MWVGQYSCAGSPGRYVGIDRLVVRDPAARGVRQRHPPPPVDFEHTGYAETGLFPRNEGIQKVVVDPPTEHIDPLGTLGRPHVDIPIQDCQIASLPPIRPPSPVRERSVRSMWSCRFRESERQPWGSRGPGPGIPASIANGSCSRSRAGPLKSGKRRETFPSAPAGFQARRRRQTDSAGCLRARNTARPGRAPGRPR